MPEKIIKHTEHFHRKTFIKGLLISKYYGELDYSKEAVGFVKEKYYDFTLYEAEIKDSIFRKNNEGEFPEFSEKEIFPGNINPKPLPCKIYYQEIIGEFQIILYDVKLANIDFNKYRALHQEEDNQVFGTVEADITGYILEKFTNEYDEIVNIEEPLGRPSQESTEPTPTTKKTQPDSRKPIFVRYQSEGCLEGIWQLVGLILGILFLIAIGPTGIIALLILAAIGLGIAYFSQIFQWLFRIAVFLMLGFTILALITSLRNRSKTPSIPFAKNDTAEIKTVRPDVINSTDSLIVHHRIWKDYDGKEYEGNIWVKVSDFQESNLFKNNFALQSNSLHEYDRVLYALEDYDSSKLYGVYKLMDSIKITNNQTATQFAETLVSFVQDIPYAIILDNHCDANLYNDPFTKTYLQNHLGECEGDQKFGINTPVEFMGSLKGDCDTRTLLLYTMLSHYGYDVALLSSEVYSHSILAINLPLTGKSITIDGKQFIAWETTSPGIKAGILPEEISNFDNWRISLYSKPNL